MGRKVRSCCWPGSITPLGLGSLSTVMKFRRTSACVRRMQTLSLPAKHQTVDPWQTSEKEVVKRTSTGAGSFRHGCSWSGLRLWWNCRWPEYQLGCVTNAAPIRLYEKASHPAEPRGRTALWISSELCHSSSTKGLAQFSGIATPNRKYIKIPRPGHAAPALYDL